MKIKEYLLHQDAVSLKYIAKKMYPNNKNPAPYITTKLKGNNPARQWTESDETLAQKILHELGVELQGL
jgi:hypothetical protein